MSYSRRSRYSRSPSFDSRSISRSPVRRLSSRSPSVDVENPGNNLYVTGLSPRITKKELENHFSTEGKVVDVHLVVDPWTRESRGFGFITMSSFEEANRCIKYLDRSVLEGRVITVEKARRRRGRTPTPGRYLGLRTVRVRCRSSPSYSPPLRSPSYSPDCSRSRSPSYYSERSRSRSYSPPPRYSRSRSRRRRSYSPPCLYYSSSSRHRLHSPYDIDRRDRDRSYSPDDDDDRYYMKSRYRSLSRSISPPRGRRRRSSRRGDDYYYPHSSSRRRRRRSYSRSRSVSPPVAKRRWGRRSYSRSISRSPRGKVVSRSRRSRRSHSSRSWSPSVRSPTPKSASSS